jgi:hypothetical protein
VPPPYLGITLPDCEVTMEFPGLEHLYQLDDEDRRRAMHVSIDTPMDLADFGMVASGLVERVDLRFHAVGGTRTYDLVPCKPLLELVSPLAREAMAPFSGWSTQSVTIGGPGSEALAGYRLLVVRGRCGPFLDARPGPYEYCRAYFNPSTWDGSDVFCPPSSSRVFVVEAVKNAIERAHLSNVHFTPMADL